jgi:hypothetical protein
MATTSHRMALARRTPASDDEGGGHPPAVPWTGTTVREVIDMPGWTFRPPTARHRQPRPTSPRRHRVACVTLALLLLATAACGRGADDSSTSPAADPGPASTNVVQRTVEVEVFFPRDDSADPCAEVFGVPRTVDADDPVTGALEALLAGPTDSERAAGYGGWFSDRTAAALLHVEVVDGTAHVVFRDLRPVIPNASTSCGSSMLLAMLDTTLLRFDGIDATRYALADQPALYGWLQLDDPDAPAPEPIEPEPDEGEAAVDLEAGWSVVDDFVWPVEPGCCSIADTGPISPPGPLPDDGWPADGFYHVEVDRLTETPELLRVTVHPWVACAERPDLDCLDRPDPAAPDTRIVADPEVETVVEVPLDEIGAVLVPIYDFRAGQLRALAGEPGALARLLTQGVDPAFRTWVVDPYLEGATESMVWADVTERGADPTFPLGLPDCPEDDYCGPVSYRGPFETFLIVNPGTVSYRDLADWPPGSNGLYAWREVTLEIRDSEPILYLWAGQIAG